MEIKKLVRKNILNMKPYSSARDEFKGSKEKMVFLDANESPFDNEVNRYPDPLQIKLKQEIIKNKACTLNQIVLGNGSDEILDLIFRVFCEPNMDNIITLPPTYGMYGVLANLNAIENREVVLNEDFQPNAHAIQKAIDDNTKLIFICSPNNPTGNCINKSFIEEFITNFKGIVVIDEAYVDFSKEESWIEKIHEFPNLIVTQTLSKAYGMAGLRLGILYANEEIVNFINKIKPPYNINQLTQKKALNELLFQEDIKNKIDLIISNKEVLLKELLSVNFIKKIYPSKANFLLIKVDDANKRYEQLLNKNIVIRNRHKQPLCDNCLRITIGTNEENKKIIETLKEIQNV